MEIKVGDKLENITLPAIDDTTFEYNSVKGKKVLLTFSHPQRGDDANFCKRLIDNTCGPVT